MSTDPDDRSNARAWRGEVADVARALEYEIVFGERHPRERLVEDALMARFGAKRHVVRQALAELARVGLVTRAPNRGAAVRDVPVREVEEIYDLRALLQRHAAELIPLPADRALVDAISAIQDRHDAAVATRDLRAIDRVNDEFHETLFAACGNGHLCDAIAHYATLTRSIRLRHIAEPAMLDRLRDEHRAMIRALTDGDRAALVRLCVAHIQPARIAYLAVRRALGLP